jgi:Recombination endonuclease VII
MIDSHLINKGIGSGFAKRANRAVRRSRPEVSMTDDMRKRWLKAYRQRPEVKAAQTERMRTAERKEYMKVYAAANGETLRENKRRYAEANKEKIRESQKNWRVKHRDRIKATYERNKTLNRLKMRARRVGISVAELVRLTEKQGDACAICRAPFGLQKNCHTDHCHRTGKVRGLLCSNCNRGLGCFRDDPKILRGAVKYLAMAR